MPILDDNGIYKRLAIVRLDTGEVALGKTKGETIREFQRIQTRNGNFVPSESSTAKQLEITVTNKFGDVQDGRTVYYLQDRNNHPEKVFTGTSNLSPFLPTVEIGDQLLIGVLDSEQEEMPMQTFELKK